MKKVGLQPRLFLSHLFVMIVGVGSLVTISKVSSPQFFVRHLEQLEGPGFTLRYARTQILEGFELAWNRSTFWAVVVGTTAAGGLSYWVAQRIVLPLMQMDEITQKFAAGEMEERMPMTEIPELNKLSMSFNRMASSLEDVESRRRQLMGDLTHELRTPLTVMRGYLEELAEGRIDASPEVYLTLIKETKRLERLVNDLQEISKAESGYLAINLQPVNLRFLLVSLIEKFSSQVLEDGPVLSLNCPQSLPLVLADIDRTEQVLVNLLGNALRYTPAGSITVRAWTEAGKVWVAVRDTGPGIAPEDLPHVFERFWRADRARTRHSGGSGLGLAISRRLVELQGGEIFVESSVGVGTTFRFWLLLA